MAGGQIAPQPAGDVVAYPLDAAASQLIVLVGRAGALGRLGHNHIISAGEMEGIVHRHPDLSKSSVVLTLPVAGFVIDDPSLRQAEGEGFSSVPSQKDIDGTRRNMTGNRLLDAANFPVISVDGRQLEIDAAGDATLELKLQVKNTAAIRRVPLTVVIGADEIAASGGVVLNHEELGLTPFKALFGALQVASPLTVRFSLKFRREPDD